MVNIYLNDTKYQIPNSYEEVTVKQYLRIQKEWDPDIEDIADKDYLKLLNILTNTKYGSFKSTSENEVTLINALSWVIMQPFKMQKSLPKALQIGDKTFLIPREPSELSIGQNIHLRREMDKVNTIDECIGIATSIYMQPIIDGVSKFNMARAQEINAEIMEMPIYLIYPIGFFLLKRAGTFGRTYTNKWHRLRINLGAKLKQTLRGWPKLKTLLLSVIYL